MTKEDYVSFETAKLLKENGFNGLCNAYYDCFTTNNFHSGCESTDFNSIDTRIRKIVSAPTLQMAMKWLREVHNLFIEMHIQNNGSYIGYIYNTNGFGLIGWDKRRVSSSYEQACEVTLKYCLENLI